MLRLSPEKARRLCEEALTACGLSTADAAICASSIMYPTLRGVDTHGIVSRLPGICEDLASSQIDPASPIEMIGPFLFKGNRAAGPVVAERAMRRAIENASTAGIGAAVAFNSGHMGAASYYAALAVVHDMIGVCMGNTAPWVVPHGGVRPFHGTNPIAYAAPGGAEPPIVFDAATGATALAKIQRARKAGVPIPLDWALDVQGRPTADPGAVAALQPFGGHKGYGISVLIDVLTGALAGSAVGLAVEEGNMHREHAGHSFFLLAVDPAAFGGRDTFKARVDQLWRDARSIPPAQGFDEVRLPGGRAHVEELRRRAEGIPLAEEDWAALCDRLGRAGVPIAALAARFGPEPA